MTLYLPHYQKGCMYIAVHSLLKVSPIFYGSSRSSRGAHRCLQVLKGSPGCSTIMEVLTYQHSATQCVADLQWEIVEKLFDLQQELKDFSDIRWGKNPQTIILLLGCATTLTPPPPPLPWSLLIVVLLLLIHCAF